MCGIIFKTLKKSRNKMILWIDMNADLWRLVCISPVEKKEGLRAGQAVNMLVCPVLLCSGFKCLKDKVGILG